MQRRSSGFPVFMLVFMIAPLARAADATDSMGAQPPSGAVVLFDGHDTSKWVRSGDGLPCPWKVLGDGAMEVRKGDIETVDRFGDFKLHIEFWVPKLPAVVKGQARGNSGVFLQRRYEVQILDSFGLKPGLDDCGAVYEVKAPNENACRAPEQWQVYDITFRAAQFDEKGKKLKNARVSVIQNGVSIHKDVEIPHPTNSGEAEAPGPAAIRLQDHGSKVRYRNIWLVRIVDQPKREKPQDSSPQPWSEMDYGSLLSATFEDQHGTGQFSEKGIAIRVGNGSTTAGVLFDTGLLRFATAWTGDFVNYTGVAFDGSHGPNPSPKGKIWFGTRERPGVSTNGRFDDKRPNAPYGPLPRETGHYNGLYRNGDRVVLSYSIGSREILDLPGATLSGDKVAAFTRTLEVAPGDQAVEILLADYFADGTTRPTTSPSAPRVFDLPRPNVTLVNAQGIETITRDGRIYLKVPPNASPIVFAAVISRDQNPTAPAKLESPRELINGGPARWAKTVETKGALGSSADAPYVVDTITVPFDNPYKSWMRIGGMDFFSDGRAAVCTWSGDVWVVSGIDEKLEKVTWKRYAAGLFQTLGLKIVHDKIYVLGRDQITRLHDLNNDGEADFYENFNNDVLTAPSFHEFAFDLQADAHGNFYFAKAGAVNPGGRGWQRITPHNGCVFRISPDGKALEVFATGVRAPNGMSTGPNGQITVSDNEGTWVPTCRLSYVHKGDFLGVTDLAHAKDKPTNYGDPIFWLPHEGVDNSSGGAVWVTSDRWGPFQNRLLHLSYGTCSMFLVMDGVVDGITQGAAVKFPDLSFDSGICRARINPIDGQVYVAGLKGWQTTAAKDACFQRIRYTGKSVRMPTSFRVKEDAIELGFTVPLDSETAGDKDSYSVEQWNYVWSSNYGSPEVSIADQNKKQHDAVEVKGVELSADHKTVTLKIPGLRPVMQMKISMKIDSADGQPMEYDIYGTINKVPGAAPASATQPVAATPTTQAAGN